MKLWTTRLVVATVLVGGLSMVWLAQGTPAHAADGAAVTAAEGVGLAALAAEDAEYIGSKKCKMCHKDEYTSWEETGHAKALDSLKPGERAEAKAKAQLDPTKDYTKDEACLACHVVGWGKKGGFELVDDEKAAGKMAKTLGMVGCESCHGPAGAYYGVHKDLKKSKAEYTWADMEKAGMVKVTAETCAACHNDKSPTHDASKEFKFEDMKEQGSHKIFPLKQRKE